MKNNKSNRSNFVIKGFSSIQIGLYILLSSYLIKSSLDGYVLDGYVDNELSDSQIELFIQIYKRIQANPSLFLEGYFNKIHQETLNLTDEEKQKIFDDHRHFPVLPDLEDMKKWDEYVKLQRQMGKKDWEIF